MLRRRQLQFATILHTPRRLHRHHSLLSFNYYLTRTDYLAYGEERSHDDCDSESCRRARRAKEAEARTASGLASTADLANSGDFFRKGEEWSSGRLACYPCVVFSEIWRSHATVSLSNVKQPAKGAHRLLFFAFPLDDKSSGLGVALIHASCVAGKHAALSSVAARPNSCLCPCARCRKEGLKIEEWETGKKGRRAADVMRVQSC